MLTLHGGGRPAVLEDRALPLNVEETVQSQVSGSEEWRERSVDLHLGHVYGGCREESGGLESGLGGCTELREGERSGNGRAEGMAG